MASEELQELIKLGPFLGIDDSTNQLDMKPGFALSANNVNTSIIKGALLPERGRTALFNASSLGITEITVIYPVVGPNNAPGVLFQGVNSINTLVTGYYDYNTATFTGITNANPFTQAIQFLNVVYTNGGQRYFPGLTAGGGPGFDTNMYQWQYKAPVVTYDVAPPPATSPPYTLPNGIGVQWTYAIAIVGFNGHIQNGDILTFTFDIPPEGTFSITYGVGTTVGIPDIDFAVLSQNIATIINTYFTTGSGAGYASKLTASVYTNFDLALNPGDIATQPAVGVLLSSNASGLIGSTYTIAVSEGGGTEGMYLVQQPGAVTPFPTTGTFFGTTNNINVGNMLGGYYFYLFTRQTIMPDETVSETSVLLDASDSSLLTYPPVYQTGVNPAAYDAPLQVTIGGATYGSNSAVTFFIGTGGATAYQWAGFNEDGTAFTTNVYRASSLQDNFQYQLVGNVDIQQGPGEPVFVDKASDLDLSGNAVLVVHRDPPPFVAPEYTTDHVQSYNFGFMAVHQNRIWALVYFNEVVTQKYTVFDEATGMNVQTGYMYLIPQVQLWYSNIARGWEWDDVDQVILLQSDVVPSQLATSMQTVGPNSYVGPDYDADYGNMPKGLTEVGTTLVPQMRRDTWVVWGDGTTSNPYVTKPLFNYGVLAAASGVLGQRGGCYFVSESGDLYFYDGSSPAYLSEDIRGLTKLSSVQPGYTYNDFTNSCLSYANQTLYWSFPTKGQTLSYDVNEKHFMSTLPYAPASRYGIASSPWNPATLPALIPNEVLAVRGVAPTIVDQWFSNPNGDTENNYQLYSWTTPYMACGSPDWTKWFSLVRIYAPKQPGIVTVSLTIDNDDEPQQTFSKTIDLSGSQKSLTKKFQGETSKIIGYYARLTVSVQSIPGQPAPIIWGVGVYGSLSKHLIVEPGESS